MRIDYWKLFHEKDVEKKEIKGRTVYDEPMGDILDSIKESIEEYKNSCKLN